MRYTAVMKLEGNFSKRKFIVNQQFFRSFNFVRNNIMFYGSAFYFRKEIGKIMVIVI